MLFLGGFQILMTGPRLPQTGPKAGNVSLRELVPESPGSIRVPRDLGNSPNPKSDSIEFRP